MVLLGHIQARRFTLQKPGTSAACIMLDIDFTADIQAIKAGKVFATKTLTSDDKGITTSGICNGPTNELLLKFEARSFWYIAFRQIPHKGESVGQYRGLQFVPTEIFGETVGVSTQEIFYDPLPVYQMNIYDSYVCATKYQTPYSSVQPTAGDFSFHVNVTIFSVQSQGFYIKNDQFGPAEHC
ncbi:hypothetical protein ElyMa_003022300 [Elysia marginata]|uniref:CUB domain-containing protein n=1 Tax=Elysia marginata TaxID=1093978 RepID=A0AAV4IGW6_9GAST|nr:hypothetical protein ElyMa_003022300 [Elysia marginata]